MALVLDLVVEALAGLLCDLPTVWTIRNRKAKQASKQMNVNTEGHWVMETRVKRLLSSPSVAKPDHQRSPVS